MPKSATDGHLKAPSHKSKFASFEFLNLITRNKSTAPAAGPLRARQDHRQDDASAKIRKKIGLGPVKVVLKWHGAGRSSRVKRTTKPEDNNKRKKRVIVYKNGDPTAGAKSGGFAASDPMKKPLEMEVKDVKKEMVNITTNPLDKVTTESRPSAEAVFRSRRYSMQERLSQPPPLVRRVSEIQTCTTGQQPIPLNNNRRNRHSWTVGTVPEFPLNSQDIGIDIDQEEEDC